MCLISNVMFKIISRAAGFVGYVIQYACIAHCTFEYVGDFVIVRILSFRVLCQPKLVLTLSFRFQCSGPSMEPTLYTNNVLFTERITKRLNRFDRGDIIVAKNPVKPEEFVCKRIVALPGDTVSIKPRLNFNPFNNSKSILTTDFNYDNDDRDKSSGQDNRIDNQDSSMAMFQSKVVLVPRGHVWIEGDNSENSSDSRMYGPIPIGLIQSRVLCRVWPFNEVRSL